MIVLDFQTNAMSINHKNVRWSIQPSTPFPNVANQMALRSPQIGYEGDRLLLPLANDVQNHTTSEYDGYKPIP